MPVPEQFDDVPLDSDSADQVHLAQSSGQQGPVQSPLEAAVDALNFAKHFLRENATTQGYGFYRPANPHDFFPDSESCTADEIANHKAACEAWDRGDFKRDEWDGWLRDADGKATMHVLRAPWGIGSYCETDVEMEHRAEALHRVSETYPMLLAALQRIAKDDPNGYFAAIALPEIARATGAA